MISLVARCFRLSLFLGLLSAMTGCAQIPEDHYQEPDLPSDQVATVNLRSTMNVFGLDEQNQAIIMGIGGKPIRRTYGQDTLKLLPGQHEVFVVYTRGRGGFRGSLPPLKLRFQVLVESGHQYILRHGKEDALKRIWVEGREGMAKQHVVAPGQEDEVRGVWVEDRKTEAVAGMASFVIEKSD